MINSVLWTPLLFGVLGLFVPRRWSGWVVTAGAALTLGLAISLLAGFDPDGGLQKSTDVAWISGLGVRYSLGLDGLNVFLMMLTAVAWLPATAFAAWRDTDRPRNYFLLLALAETAVMGAFFAQDLLLFVLFFDLMLVPFYFLFGIWGQDRPGGSTASAATLKMLVYTLVGSLLMLVGAIATAIIAADGGDISFALADLRAEPSLGEQPALDLLVLRRRLPGQDAGLSAARVDGGRLPCGAAPGACRVLRPCSRRSPPTAS